MSRSPRILFSLLIGISVCFTGLESATAREIDNEKTVSTEQIQLAQALPKTLVVRRKTGTDQVEVLHLNQVLKVDEKSRQLVSTASFIKIDSNGKMVGELDRDSSSSSWAFRFAPRGGIGRGGYGYGGGRPGYGYGRPGYGYGRPGYGYGRYRYGYGRPGYGYGRYGYGYGRYRYGYGYYPRYGYGRYYGYRGYPYDGYYGSSYYPSYSYSGYNYPYSPYYSYYNDGDGYNYDYYGSPYNNPYAVSVSY